MPGRTQVSPETQSSHQQVNSLPGRMSESEENRRKGRLKFVKERSADYRKNNPEMKKLSKEKVKLSVLKKKSEDADYVQELRKEEKDRNAEQRKKKQLKK